MAERIRPTEASGRRGMRRWRLRIAAALLAGMLLIGGICLLVRAWSDESSAQYITTVNAGHALAPEENAATIYHQLAAGSVLTGDRADPNLSAAAVSALLEASKIVSCWFPLSPGEQCYRDHARRTRPMREWAGALAKAAREDIAQGHVDAAAEKLHCIIRMGCHLRQQALLIDFGVGCDVEFRAWTCLRDFAMQPGATEELLKVAETMPGELADNGTQAFRLVLDVQPLISASVLAEWGLRYRVSNWWRLLRSRTDEEILKEWHLRLLSCRRGVHILVGLKRYHDETGQWPESLDEIKTKVPEQALIDPYTEQLFVYRVTEDGFCLYSKGANKIDENGARTPNGADDRRIWPP